MWRVSGHRKPLCIDTTSPDLVAIRLGAIINNLGSAFTVSPSARKRHSLLTVARLTRSVVLSADQREVKTVRRSDRQISERPTPGRTQPNTPHYQERYHRMKRRVAMAVS